MKNQKTTMTAIGFMLLSAVFASLGQVFFKFAANNIIDVSSFILNPHLYAGGILYLVGLVFMLKALRRGELSVVYPALATSFIWVSLLSPIFFDADFMTLEKWVGVLIIIVGVSLVGKGRTK